MSISETQAQTKKKIEIKYSGFLNVEEKLPGAKILTRDDTQQVHIYHAGSNLWCDKAFYYSEDNFIEAYGNVIVKQGDTINMTSKYVEYSGITELAFAYGDVILNSPDSKISSDTIYFDRVRQQSFYKSGGTVVKDTSLTITSKIGRYYMDLKKFQFVDNVVLESDDSTIESNYFDYYEETGHAYLFGPSTITTEESITYCEKGFYDTENEVGYALKKARIDYDNRIIEGDSLYFDNNKNFASATNNIKVTDTINKSIIKGHYAEVFKEKDSLFITKRALAITVQENDSIYMHADKIMVTGKEDHRIINAYYKAKIFKTDLSGKSDSINTNQKTGITKLINIPRFSSGDKFSTKRKPIMWNLENQMTGDTIHLISNTETEKIDSLVVFNNAFIISKDTISENGHNQIYGMRLVGLFNKENQLRQVDITKNAESIFYTRNDKQELIGIDKAKSGSISILFDDGDIEEYTRHNQADGVLYPESQYPVKEEFLKGFDWREEERPKSVEDLFKDDPPYELPIIKGLEDYIPQGKFFDEELLERIRLAGKNAPKKNNLDSSIKREKKQINLLLSSNEFTSKDWSKVRTVAKPSNELDPYAKNKTNIITGTTDKNSYVFQEIDKLEGKFRFSVWIKGKGAILITSQKNGGNYSNYKSLGFSLTSEWKEYSISFTKLKDGQKFRVLINNITSSDKVYAWGAELIEID